MDKPKRTEVKPFSFESRDKERYQKKEEKIKEIMEGEKKVLILVTFLLWKLRSTPPPPHPNF